VLSKRTAVGIDVGVAHTVTTSNAAFFDRPDTSHLDALRKQAQKRMAKSRTVALKQHRKFYESNRYQAHKSDAARLSGQIARVRDDWAQKTSTALVREHDIIGLEKLNLRSMTKRAHGRGASAKRGLNRAMSNAALGQVRELIAYKARFTGTEVILVPAAYTSQRCNQCSHIASENRKSQAVFLCVKCGHQANADVNAAMNIKDDALRALCLTTSKPSSKTTATPQKARAMRLAGSTHKTHPKNISPVSRAHATNRKPPLTVDFVSV